MIRFCLFPLVQIITNQKQTNRKMKISLYHKIRYYSTSLLLPDGQVYLVPSKNTSPAIIARTTSIQKQQKTIEYIKTNAGGSPCVHLHAVENVKNTNKHTARHQQIYTTL